MNGTLFPHHISVTLIYTGTAFQTSDTTHHSKQIVILQPGSDLKFKLINIYIHKNFGAMSLFFFLIF
jgi:hypothetical protein